MGEDCHYTIFEAELLAIALAVGALHHLGITEPVNLATDSQAAIKALRHYKSGAGSHLIDRIL
jgi:ribonuclease HI